MTTLVIVESPNKVKSISKYAGPGYKITASLGHVRDLPSKELCVVPPSYDMPYEATDRGKGVLIRLKKELADAGGNVILATDPDREGEAIAWHLAQALKIKEPRRVTFGAITEKVVQQGLASPRAIDMNLVRAQEARRALDHIVGYRVSPALSQAENAKLSAGRVQSSAVRLVVEREREIAAFKPTHHFGVNLMFAGDWSASWDTKPHLADGQAHILDQALAEAVATVRQVVVTSCTDKQAKKAPPAPFTTGKLQKAASSRLKFKPKQTMDMAQRLFELGVITYHRTDSPNLSDDGYADIAAYAGSVGLPLAETRRSWKAKDNAQEGHEAIRPTHCAHTDALQGVTNAALSDDERALYRLIWQQAVASQLADAIYAVRKATLASVAPVSYQGQALTPSFIAQGSTLLIKGWLAVAQADADADAEDDEDESADETSKTRNPVPALNEGQQETADDAKLLHKSTKAPARFKIGALVDELEARGIGRPATYASILENITTRGYILVGSKDLVVTPTPLGCTVVDRLVGAFKFIEYDYTAGLESELDAIAGGKAQFRDVVRQADAQLDGELASFGAATRAAAPAHPCPQCGGALRRRPGKKAGTYWWSCSGYPTCTATFPDDQGKPGERKAPAASDHVCKACGKPLARRQGKGKKGDTTPLRYGPCCSEWCLPDHPEAA